jgi:hypothetical protein
MSELGEGRCGKLLEIEQKKSWTGQNLIVLTSFSTSLWSGGRAPEDPAGRGWTRFISVQLEEKKNTPDKEGSDQVRG